MGNYSGHGVVTRAETTLKPGEGLPPVVAASVVLGTLLFICAAFTAVGSLVLLWMYWRYGIREEPGFMLKLVVKAGAFLAVSVVVAWRLDAVARRQFRRSAHPQAPKTPLEGATAPKLAGATRRALPWLGVVLVLCAVLAFPHLDRYPRAEPDEVHHLIVARNLAEHGIYASGHPDAGFKLLDNYDSVGPPVIGPVAAAFRVADTKLVVGRIVMALFFLAFCGAVYWFCAPLFGPYRAVLSVAFVAASWGTIYLARTLYGEVPALFLMLIGLSFWRRAIHSQNIVAGLFAGACFGCSVLCKPFMINVAWAFLGACVYDRVAFRAIRWRHVLAPGVMAFLILLAWWMVHRVYASDATDITAETLALYKHNLMFGLRSAPRALAWILQQPVTLLVILVALIPTANLLFRHKYDPAGIVLLFLMPFVAYWWVFFTPGNIPRYFWYVWALGGVITGPLVWDALHWLWSGPNGVGRVTAFLSVVMAVVPALGRTYDQAERVVAWDEMRDERALAEFVGQLPKDATVATTVWPLEGTLNFLAGRYVHRAKGIEEALARYDVVIGDTASPEPSEKGPRVGRQFGKYGVFERKDKQEP